jgi:predicted  nucleic acid-binding Zn-ribbon protein
VLARLIALQDLLQLKRDMQDSAYEEIGFPATAPDAMAALESEIEKLKAEIDPRVLKRYETIARKYERPLVPVRKGVCFGCFVRFPTARVSQKTSEVTTCENCGRLLYDVP